MDSNHHPLVYKTKALPIGAKPALTLKNSFHPSRTSATIAAVRIVSPNTKVSAAVRATFNKWFNMIDIFAITFMNQSFFSHYRPSMVACRPILDLRWLSLVVVVLKDGSYALLDFAPSTLPPLNSATFLHQSINSERLVSPLQLLSARQTN